MRERTIQRKEIFESQYITSTLFLPLENQEDESQVGGGGGFERSQLVIFSSSSFKNNKQSCSRRGKELNANINLKQEIQIYFTSDQSKKVQGN